MKLTFLLPYAHAPVMGPVTVLAGIAAKHAEVEVIAPDLGQGVCEMYTDSFDYKVVSTPRLYRLPDYFHEVKKIHAAITGDVIFAVKAFPNTVSVALKQKKLYGKKAFAYLDEWDGALMAMRSRRQRLKAWFRHIHHPLEDPWFPLVETKLSKLDGVLSTSTFLQKKFGGEILHMGVDTDFFKPQGAAVRSHIRRQYGLSEKHVIVFGGVVRPHKGIELILDALVLLADHSNCLFIVGPETDYLKQLRQHEVYRDYLVCAGAQPKEKMPQFLDAGDLVVLPLNETLLAQSQVPCKIFESMAMAKPVIATRVSDLPSILKGCGWVTKSNAPDALADSISYAFSHNQEAQSLGLKARERCIHLYSREQTEANIVAVLNLYPAFNMQQPA